MIILLSYDIKIFNIIWHKHDLEYNEIDDTP